MKTLTAIILAATLSACQIVKPKPTVVDTVDRPPPAAIPTTEGFSSAISSISRATDKTEQTSGKIGASVATSKATASQIEAAVGKAYDLGAQRTATQTKTLIQDLRGLSQKLTMDLEASGLAVEELNSVVTESRAALDEARKANESMGRELAVLALKISEMDARIVEANRRIALANAQVTQANKNAEQSAVNLIKEKERAEKLEVYRNIVWIVIAVLVLAVIVIVWMKVQKPI